MSQRSTTQHYHTDTPLCTIRKSHVTWNFAVRVPHSEEIRRCILLFSCTLGIVHAVTHRVLCIAMGLCILFAAIQQHVAIFFFTVGILLHHTKTSLFGLGRFLFVSLCEWPMHVLVCFSFACSFWKGTTRQLLLRVRKSRNQVSLRASLPLPPSLSAETLN